MTGRRWRARARAARTQRRRAAAAVEADLGSDKLFAVVNNAGVGLSATASAEDILNTNYFGPKRVSAAFMPLLVAMASSLSRKWLHLNGCLQYVHLVLSGMTGPRVRIASLARLGGFG